MKHISIRVLLLFAALAACDRGLTPTDTHTPPSFSSNGAEGRYIVVLQEGADPAAVAASVAAQTNFVYRHALTGFSAVLSPGAFAALAANPAVRWIEPVRVHQIAQTVQAPPQNKPCRGKKCPPAAPAGCTPGPGDPNNHDSLTSPDLWGIRRVNSDLSTTWINEPVVVDVAILDTGADLANTDLCIHRSTSFDPFESDAQDRHGHGTHVSGTAAARDDNGTVVGVAPEARLWIVKVCNQFGSCFGDAIIAGVDYVTANAAEIDVANMSLGGGGSDQAHAQNDCEAITGDAEHLAICKSVRAGVTYVVAAGNSSSDAAGFVPAAYDEVITVAAMNSSDGAAGFSNYGADVDFIAPGVGIISDAIGGGTATMSGTSMASPHGAGGAALYIAKQMNAGNPRPSPFNVRNALVAAGQTWAGQGGLHPEVLLDVKTF